jgi:hypothetical protein
MVNGGLTLALKKAEPALGGTEPAPGPGLVGMGRGTPTGSYSMLRAS